MLIETKDNKYIELSLLSTNIIITQNSKVILFNILDYKNVLIFLDNICVKKKVDYARNWLCWNSTYINDIESNKIKINNNTNTQLSLF